MAAFSGRTSIMGERDLYEVNAKNGRGRIIAKGTPSTRYWVVSPEGHVVARVDHTEKSDRYRILVPTDKDLRGGWKTVYAEETEIPSLRVYGVNTDGTALIIGTTQKSGLFGLFEMSLNDGKIGDALFEHAQVDVSGIMRDNYSGAVVGATFVLDGYDQQFFVGELQSVLGTARKLLPDRRVTLRSWDKTRQKFVVYSQGPQDAGTYHLLEFDTKSFSEISKQRPDLPPDQVAQTSSFWIEARDGVPVHSFLTIPPSAEPRNLPMVVMPHGGPASRDTIAFDWWAQFMASRGYAVLKMNFRGSEGYGKAFEQAGYGEWGGTMQDDVTDAVIYAINEGIADPARICIVGGSYGGFAALAGAAFTPNLYKCAVSVNGVSDLGAMISMERRRYGSDSPAVSYWEKSIGPIADEPGKKGSRSPIDAAADVQADILLIHGKDDTVVAHRQSELMHDALNKAGKQSELVTLRGEDHWLSKSETRIEMLRYLESFLAKHLGGTTTPAN